MKGSLKERKKELSDYVSDFVFEEFPFDKFSFLSKQSINFQKFGPLVVPLGGLIDKIIVDQMYAVSHS